MNTSITLDVFGRLVLAVQSDQGWSVFYLSNDGKRRPANDIVVPASVTGSELETYLADLCHEWATDKNPKVRRKY